MKEKPPVVVVRAARWRYWFWTLLIVGPATAVLLSYSLWFLVVAIPVWALLLLGPLRSR